MDSLSYEVRMGLSAVLLEPEMRYVMVWGPGGRHGYLGLGVIFLPNS